MLAAILPGIRHVRTPLVVGSLYFLAFWMMIGPENLHFSLEGDSIAEQRAAALASGLPATLLWSACAVAAVIAGSRATFAFWNRLTNEKKILPSSFDSEIKRRISSYRLTVKQINASQLFENSPFFIEPEVPVTDEEREQNRRFPDSRPERKPYRDQGDGLIHVFSQYTNVEGWMIWPEVKKTILTEADVMLTRLKIEQESVFDDIDRQRSEAELRFSILLPLALIVGTLAVTWHVVLGLLAVPLAAMAHQAYRIETSARKEVFVALQQGVVDSPTLEALAALGAPEVGISDVDLMADLRDEFGDEGQIMPWLESMNFNAQCIAPQTWTAFRTAVERWRPLETEFRDPSIGSDFRRFIRRLVELQQTMASKLQYVERRGPTIVEGPYYQGDRLPSFGVLVESLRWRVVYAYRDLMKAADDRGL